MKSLAVLGKLFFCLLWERGRPSSRPILNYSLGYSHENKNSKAGEERARETAVEREGKKETSGKNDRTGEN